MLYTLLPQLKIVSRGPYEGQQTNCERVRSNTAMYPGRNACSVIEHQYVRTMHFTASIRIVQSVLFCPCNARSSSNFETAAKGVANTGSAAAA